MYNFDSGACRQWLIICLSIGNAEIIIPFKRKRKKKGEPKDELTEQQKEANTRRAFARISIEHSNAGFKRNHSVTTILRNTSPRMSDLLAMVAMGLHNLLQHVIKKGRNSDTFDAVSSKARRATSGIPVASFFNDVLYLRVSMRVSYQY